MFFVLSQLQKCLIHVTVRISVCFHGYYYSLLFNETNEITIMVWQRQKDLQSFVERPCGLHPTCRVHFFFSAVDQPCHFAHRTRRGRREDRTKLGGAKIALRPRDALFWSQYERAEWLELRLGITLRDEGGEVESRQETKSRWHFSVSVTYLGHSAALSVTEKAAGSSSLSIPAWSLLGAEDF